MDTNSYLTSIKENRSWMAVALAALLMPFYHNWSIIAIALLFPVLLSDPNVRKKLSGFRKNRLLYPFILLYIMYGIGLLYSKNLEDGLTDMESILPLLLFPVFFSALDFNKAGKLNFVMLSFIAGCLLAGLVCLGVAFYDWSTTGENRFFYTDLSLFMHPGYFALYLNLVACYIYQQLIFEDESRHLKKSVMIFILFFSNTLILFLSSKAGIFTAGLMLLIMLVVSIIGKKNTKNAVTLFLGMAVLSFLFFKAVLPGNKERIINSEQALMNKPLLNTSTESSGVRLLIWKASLPIVKEHFLFGVGTGDVNEELKSAYKSNNIAVAYNLELNAHNQFLQTLLATGLGGLILLLLSLLLPFLKGINDKNFLLYIFFFIMAFNFLFESMLERQVGVVFFAFFGTLLILSDSGYAQQRS